MITLRDCYGPFNKNLNKLVHIAYLCNRRDYEMLALQDKIKLVIRNTELEPIKSATPKFQKYRDQIESRDEDFFISGNFDEEISGQDVMEKNEVNTLIKKLKVLYNNMRTEEKQEVWDLVEKLLESCDLYTRYLEVQ